MIRIVDWNQLQHYKNRNPPWVKLHRDWLDNPKFLALTIPERYLLWGLFLLASMLDNEIPPSPRWIAKKLQSDSASGTAIMLQNIKNQGLIAFDSLDASENACLREQSTEKKTSIPSGSSSPRPATDSPEDDARRITRAREDDPDPLTIPPLPPSGRYADDDYQSLIKTLSGKTLTPKQLDSLRAFLEQRYNGDQLEALGRILAVMRAEKFGLGFLVSQLRKPEELYLFERKRWTAKLTEAFDALGPGGRPADYLAAAACRLDLPESFIRQLQPLPEEEA